VSGYTRQSRLVLMVVDMACIIKNIARTCNHAEMHEECNHCGFNEDVINEREEILYRQGLTLNPVNNLMFLYVGNKPLPKEYKTGFRLKGLNE